MVSSGKPIFGKSETKKIDRSYYLRRTLCHDPYYCWRATRHSRIHTGSLCCSPPAREVAGNRDPVVGQFEKQRALLSVGVIPKPPRFLQRGEGSHAQPAQRVRPTSVFLSGVLLYASWSNVFRLEAIYVGFPKV